jgi:hypothetical protein
MWNVDDLNSVSFFGKFATVSSIREELPCNSDNIVNAASQLIAQGNSATPLIPPVKKLKWGEWWLSLVNKLIIPYCEIVDSLLILSRKSVLKDAISEHRLSISKSELKDFNSTRLWTNLKSKIHILQYQENAL